MGTNEENRNVKQAVLMRYPFSPFEEASRQLIMYKTFRGNRRIFKALAVMDELIDFVTLDPDTQKRTYEMSQEQLDQKKTSLILIPKMLVIAFKQLYHGPRVDGEIPMRALAPGPNMNPKDNLVYIRELVQFKQAWGETPNPAIVYIAGFSYTVQVTQENGFTVSHHIPMIDWANPDIDTFWTNSIPFYYWAELYDKTWRLLAPICTMIEKIIAAKLFQNNITSGFGNFSNGGNGGDDSGESSQAEIAAKGDENSEGANDADGEVPEASMLAL